MIPILCFLSPGSRRKTMLLISARKRVFPVKSCDREVARQTDFGSRDINFVRRGSIYEAVPLRRDFNIVPAHPINAKRSHKSYECNSCKKVFPRASSLSVHRRIHIGSKDFKCPECFKTFLRKADMQKHYRIHTGEAPYRCNICNRSFNQSSNMLSHRRRHPGENPGRHKA